MSDLAALIEKLERHSIPEPNSGCVLWTGSVSASSLGYGSLRHEGKTWRAHRAAWIAQNGDLPPGYCVCHKCDTPLCINPDHLFLGTKAANNADCRNKKRNYWFRSPELAQKQLASARSKIKAYACGERAGPSKMTEEQIRAIRSALGSQGTIARQFGLTQSTVHSILKRKTWKHV